VGAFGADGCGRAVSGIDDHVIGQHEQLLADRADYFRHRAAPQIGASNAALKKSVACEEQRGFCGAVGDGFLRGSDSCDFWLYDEADASRRVAGGVQNLGRVTAPAQRVAFLHEILDIHDGGSGHAEPLRLHIEMAVEFQIVLMNQDRRACGAMQRGEAADVVNMRVRADDRANFQIMAAESFEDALGLVARVHNDGFARYRIAENRAVAFQQADGNDFVDEVCGHEPHYNRTNKSGSHGRQSRLRASDKMKAGKSMDTRQATDKPKVIFETPLAAEHRAAGARLAEYNGCVLPEMFSDFESEYRAAKETVALLDTNWHAVMTLSGRDRVRYLHAVTSNDIKSLGENFGTRALLLNPQGHILAELEVYALQEKLLVLSHASVRERTFATLKKYILGSQVQLEDITDQTGSLAVEGPRAASVIAQATGLSLDGFSELSLAEVAVDGVPCHLIRRSHFGGEGAELIAPREHIGLLWKTLHASVQALDGKSVGMQTLNALRLEAGIPWFPTDFNDGMIPHEAGVENSHISYSKGCYTGQEIVERVRSRGHVNKRRVQLKFSIAAPPPPGTKLCASGPNGVEVGYVTSAAFSPAARGAIGMGYLRREHNSPGSIVDFDGGTAEVVEKF
jgi:tRNA-modifying protein YgfZ